MIKELHIKNFLSHKKTKLKLSPGVNIIVGETDSGKSAIIRALRWVITNRPTGDSFRSYWGGKTSVRVVLNTGSVERSKTDSGNEYLLKREKKSDLLFKAFKTDIPDEVKEVLNMDETNLQTQFESHFLISKSPGEVAQHFNRVAHLDKIDIGIRNTQKQIKVIQGAISAGEMEINRHTDTLSKFTYIPTVEAKIVHLEALNASQLKKEKEVDSIDELVRGVLSVNNRIEDAEKLLTHADLVNKILGYFSELKVAYEKQDKLTVILDSIDLINKDFGEADEILSAESKVDELLKMIEATNEITSQMGQLKSVVRYAIQIEDEEKRCQLELIGLEKSFEKNMGAICLLCGNKIKK